MTFNCFVTQEITGRLSSGLAIDPKDYLYCEDETEFKDSIKDDIYDSINYGNLCKIDIEWEDYDIPNELITEWHKLKNEGI